MARKSKKYHYIYKTTNLKNGKYYIGMHSTDNLEDGYMGSGKRLRRSLNKYGKENFKFEILEFLSDRISLKEREKELVNEELLKDSLSMNLKLGGEGGFVDEEHKIKFLNKAITMFTVNKEKIVERKKWLWENNKEWRDNFSEKLSISKIGNLSWTGLQHTEDTKRKIGVTNSIKQMGENNSQFGTCWITNGEENKKIKKEEIIPDGWKLGRKIKNE
jgi:hypothetical protein